MNRPWHEVVSARLRSLKEYFASSSKEVLGVNLEGNRAYMVLARENEAGKVEILWQDMVEAGQVLSNGEGLCEYKESSEKYFEQEVAGEDSWGQESVDRSTLEEELLELACLRAQEYCGENTICCLALKESQVYYYERFFPELKPKEMEQAVRLDFAASSAWQEKFYCSYQALGQGILRVGGIKAGELEARLRLLKREYDFVQGVLVCSGDKAELHPMKPGEDMAEGGANEAGVNEAGDNKAGGYMQGGFQGALYAAVCSLRNQGMVFRPYKEYLCRWNWLHLTQVMWGAAVVLLAILWGTGWYMQQDLDKELAQVQGRLQLMQDIEARYQAIEENRQIMDKKNRLLAELSQRPHTGQGTLVRLGQGIEEGIYLTELKCQGEGRLALKGRADLYGSISGLLADWNRQEASQGQGGLALETADMGPDGRIDFQISGKV